MMEALNNLTQLRDSRFGQPRPRHGLKLLYWFAKDCVSFGNDNVMISECDPANGDFGFHHFENRHYNSVNKLLPDRYYPYYVVGNLNIKKYPKAKDLLEYVSEDKSTDQHNSNTDRIIVSLSKKRQFQRVYVTQHRNRSNYDPNATYRISRGLLMIIRRRMRLEHFLEEMGYCTSILPVINYRPQTKHTDFTEVTPSSSDSDDSESPETQNNDTIIPMDDDTSSLNSLEILPERRFWKKYCTIL
ncbi:hypothetical protein ABG768_001343 [Culter alburnus]|uniref:Uncharacterized protein n=1 Tax=Culter alburnus TaxID=194366 RepID=A0AAW2B782_CULAL